jgi:nitrite reductase/ring-hydroxylating ferredoxin subunit
MIRFLTLLGVLTIILLGSCNKGSNQTMPYVPVDIYVNTSLPLYTNLNIIGGWSYVAGGNDGIILYRQSYDNIVAYERRCTNDAFNACGFSSVDSSNVVVVCACDGSEYSIFDGSLLKGPATVGLFQYRTTYNPDVGDLHVFN